MYTSQPKWDVTHFAKESVLCYWWKKHFFFSVYALFLRHGDVGFFFTSLIKYGSCACASVYFLSIYSMDLVSRLLSSQVHGQNSGKYHSHIFLSYCLVYATASQKRQDELLSLSVHIKASKCKHFIHFHDFSWSISLWFSISCIERERKLHSMPLLGTRSTAADPVRSNCRCWQ